MVDDKSSCGESRLSRFYDFMTERIDCSYEGSSGRVLYERTRAGIWTDRALVGTVVGTLVGSVIYFAVTNG
ncbi:MAG: hypothetical protein KJ718_03200 [Nanoarchaeota archaeon]|nr:hypothetical protein [Nanoarchaeota archaeon]MBU1051535.1 hypothetical protein [Nanoarchaeota archaeon]MBU1988209.1 hypothetical protein [Nanoarchaeota archaeon]